MACSFTGCFFGGSEASWSCVLTIILPDPFHLPLATCRSQLPLPHESQLNLCSFLFHFVYLTHVPYPVCDFSHVYSPSFLQSWFFLYPFSDHRQLSFYLFLLSYNLFIKSSDHLFQEKKKSSEFAVLMRSYKKHLWRMENFCLKFFCNSILWYIYSSVTLCL